MCNQGFFNEVCKSEIVHTLHSSKYKTHTTHLVARNVAQEDVTTYTPFHKQIPYLLAYDQICTTRTRYVAEVHADPETYYGEIDLVEQLRTADGDQDKLDALY